MNKKSQITLILTIFVLLIVVAGVSVAYFRKPVVQANNNVVSTLSCLNISLTDQTNAISLTNDYAITDEEGLKRTPYTFRVTNNCQNYIKVNINLESLPIASNKLNREYVKASLTEVGSGPIIKKLDSSSNATPTIQNAESNTLRRLSLNSGEYKDFELRLWIDEDTTKEQGMGKSYQAKIVIVANAAIKGDPAPEGWDDAPKGSLLAGIRSNQIKPNLDTANGMTVPGRELTAQSGEYISEGLRTAEDDYGVSYYYRGAINNNYIVFAGMCWRIVRIDGNGNIKLVLYNYKKDLQNPCSISGTDLAYARDKNGAEIVSRWSLPRDTNSYIGLMYGSTAANASYDDAHANNNESSILGVLKTWYTNNFSENEKNKLADVVWCNDKSLADTEYQLATYTDYVNTGIGTQKTAYGAAERLISNTAWEATTTGNPTFKCPDSIGSNKDLSRFSANKYNGNGKLNIEGTAYKIGLLTADEVAYAGGIYSTSNSTYYLNQNASSNAKYWWTLSPCFFSGVNARVFYVKENGAISNNNVNTYNRLRPAIALKSDVQITNSSMENIGTANNPFIVQ